jgi:hypothetical protein
MSDILLTHSRMNAAATEWLQPVPWQLFTTLKFPYSASNETATRKYSDLINNIEHNMRTRVCSVSAIENRSKYGERVPLHIHSALACLKPIPPELVTDLWNAGVGRGNSENNDLSVIKRFDSTICGIEYILKQVNDPDCEWDFRNIHLFNPNVRLEPKLDHKSLRSARRWHKQVSIAAAA